MIRAGFAALMAVALAGMPAGVAVAETGETAQTGAVTPPPYPVFQSKRISAAPASGAQRIRIQIDPDARPFERFPSATPGLRLEDDPTAPEDVRWAVPGEIAPGDRDTTGYWARVSPRLADAGAGRLPSLIAALGAQPAPRLRDMEKIARIYGDDIRRHTAGTRISPALVAAVIAVESGGRREAVSHAGAQGVMQLMPDTAARFGVTDWQEPSENIRGGVAYLDWLSREFGRDPAMILAGYNAGEGAVRKHAGVPPYAETRAYVPKVLAAWKVATALCRTPPSHIGDACDFVPEAASRTALTIRP